MRDRTRLAVELHDTISQNLTGATMQIGTAAQFVGTDAARAVRHIDIATRTLDACREELRNCIWDLRSNTLDEQDLNEALRRTVQRLVGEARLEIRLDVPREKLSDNTVHALMNIVRELATNAVRHGGASVVRIEGALEGGMLRCTVSDDGCGFDPDNRPGMAEGHFGLQGIEERIDELGGELDIHGGSGEGARISFRIPAE
jgi:NarL family two-component system sensor histidine kinase LiaS